MNQLLKLKNDSLSTLSVICGSPIKSTKKDKATQLIHTLNNNLSLPTKFNILSIDIGIKNFSYCKILQVDINKPLSYNLNFKTWKTIDLNVAYPNDFLHDTSDIVPLRQKLGYLNYNIFKDLLINVPQLEKPHLVLIENQRIKSNNNQVTLPGILINYVFENLFYTNYETLKHYENLNSILIPMNSNRLTNYLINRFLIKSEINSKNSKILRNKFVFNLLHKKLVNLSPDQEKLTDKKSFLQYYNLTELQKISKLDDLFDSLLYSISFVEYYRNNCCLNHYLVNDLDLNELIFKLNNNSVYNLKSIPDLGLNDMAKDLGGKWEQLPDFSDTKRVKYSVDS